MTLLDTNVLSETMRPSPAAVVTTWLNQQPALELAISTVAVAEIRCGLQRQPEGGRRRQLEDGFLRLVLRGFAQRVFAFDLASAEAYGSLMAHRRQSGRPMSVLDGRIAAIARTRGCDLAMRNTADFEGLNIALIDPWVAGQAH